MNVYQVDVIPYHPEGIGAYIRFLGKTVPPVASLSVLREYVHHTIAAHTGTSNFEVEYHWPQ